MTLSALIQLAIHSPLLAEHVEAAAGHLHLTVEELYDLFATTVAKQYLKGNLSYGSGDAAMNGLFGYGTTGGGPELTRLAWRVFEAFDEGEYLHAGEPAEQQGEPKTRMLLARITELHDA